jgi:transcriptional regulator with XRE-family HTH domain
MTVDAEGLMVHCQFALKLTQAQLGELVGVHKRTIQRWQQGRFLLTPDQAERLAVALQPVRPDLAKQVLEMGREFAASTGTNPPVLPATPEEIEEVVRAAAQAGGMSPDAIRASIAAAFTKAAALDLEVRDVVAGLR